MTRSHQHGSLLDDRRSTAYAHTLLPDLRARVSGPDAVLSDDLERLISTTVSAGWRPWGHRQRVRLT